MLHYFFQIDKKYLLYCNNFILLTFVLSIRLAILPQSYQKSLLNVVDVYNDTHGPSGSVRVRLRASSIILLLEQIVTAGKSIL